MMNWPDQSRWRPCRGHSHEAAPTLAGNADIPAIFNAGLSIRPFSAAWGLFLPKNWLILHVLVQHTRTRIRENTLVSHLVETVGSQVEVIEL